MTMFIPACNLCANNESNQHPLQVAKVLLLGDARAFFTMYKAIVDVGLKPFQLDRDERLLKAGLPAEELKKAAGEAAAAADCILVTHQQLASPGFPFERYVLYVLKGFARDRNKITGQPLPHTVFWLLVSSATYAQHTFKWRSPGLPF